MKQSYKIPAGLDTSYMDMTITIQKEGGLGLKPLKMKQLFIFIVTLFSGLFIQQKTFVGDVSIGCSIVFLIIWFGTGIYLGLTDSSKVIRAEMLPAVLSYIQPDHRKVYKVPVSFYNVSEIAKDGRVTFADGTCGYVCAVVGSASVLLFDSDRDAILNRVDMFWRKQTPGVEFLFVTVKKAQDVSVQRKHIRSYDLSEPDLKRLAREQDMVLRDYVGKEFKSIHQYMFIKAPNAEILRQTYNVLQSEVENSHYMFKRCVQLSDETIADLINTIY